MEIHACASRGDLEGVRRELQQGVSVDQRDKEDYTPLGRAAGSPSANEEMLRLLIDAGADVTASQSKSGRFAFGMAVGTGDLDKAQVLLDRGANINAVSEYGYSALIDIFSSRYDLYRSEMLMSVVEYLVTNGADVHCVTVYQETPLKSAYAVRRIDAIRYLIEAGADGSCLKWSNLMFAIAIGTVGEVQRSLEKSPDLEHRDCYKRTPLLLTAIIGDVEKAKSLYAAGANLEASTGLGETALIFAAENDRVEMLKWLIGLKLNLESINSPDSREIWSENKWLNDLGVDPAVVSGLAMTVLMKAAESGSTSCVRVLLKAGVDPNRSAGSSRGSRLLNPNPMSVASNIEIIRLLVAAGADLNDANFEMRLKLTGLSKSEDFFVSQSEYDTNKNPRFGCSNPEVMQIPFWSEMLRTGTWSYTARKLFEDTENLDTPVWCFDRFGTTFTELPDGRFVHIGGEHEDSYDPDFYIYNDVIVHESTGEFRILGYPEEIFPPTDSHSATFVDGSIYIIGRLGYTGHRLLGTTPIYRLNCTTWSMESVESSGDNPGWIYNHKVRLIDPKTLGLTGGEIISLEGSQERNRFNSDVYTLDLSTMVWTCVRTDSPPT